MNDTGTVPPYGVAIRNALENTNIDEMKAASAAAHEYLAEADSIRESLRKLDMMILMQEGGADRVSSADIVPYGDPIRAAIESGDQQQMRKVADMARAWLDKAKDVEANLRELEKIIS